MRTLQSGIDKASRYALLDAAAGAVHQLPPVYIMSHRRADALDTFKTLPYLIENATLVIAEHEHDDYRAKWPRTSLELIPADYGHTPIGHGRALQYIVEHAHKLGQEQIIILDDDLRGITPLFSLEDGDRVSRVRPKPSEGRDRYYLGGLVTMALVAREAFAEVPEAVIASPQVNNADRRLVPATRRWMLSHGGNPAQFQFIHVPRLMDRTGGFDAVEFALHGADIAVACDITAAGGAVVDMPAFVTEWRDYESESVMRTPATAHLLRQGEHDALMKKPLAKYIRTRYDMLDRPQWHSLNWKALQRDGLAPSETCLWSDPSDVVIEDPLPETELAELI